MRFSEELTITGLFLAVYLPISMAMWIFSKKTDLIIILLISLAIITAYWIVKIIIEFSRTEKYAPDHECIRLKTDSEARKETAENEFESYTGFRRIFSENNNGGETT